jgi:hypothetical protein
MLPPDYQDPDIGSRFVIVLTMFATACGVVMVSAVLMPITVTTIAVSVTVPAAVVPITAGTCESQDNG